MLKALTFGFGVGAAVQAWRNWPATALVTADSLALVFCAGLVAAYFAGRRTSRGTSSASATATAVAASDATATASNQVNVAFFVPGAGAGSQTGGVSVPSDAAPWIASSTTTPQLTADHLEGMDLAEVLDSHPDHEPRF